MFGQRAFAIKVTFAHRADLRHGDVALIGKENSVFGQIFEKRGRGFPGFTSCEVARIVFNPRAKALRGHHFQIKFRALGNALGFEELAIALKLLEAGFQLGLDAFHRRLHGGTRRDVMGIGIDPHAVHIALGFAC